MKSLNLFSPAKLNLSFRVLKKRPDGYHDICSLFQAITLGDRLVISSSTGEDTCSCEVSLGSNNLVLQAANLFRLKTGIQDYFHFELSKQIPVMGGLGGGSSNAATTLWGLNRLLDTRIDDATLARWGAELGADVPFFFSCGRALCEGRGEQLTLLETERGPPLWLAIPKEGLSTAAVFANHTMGASAAADLNFYHNDLEESAFSLMPQLVRLKHQLLSWGYESCTMTGSGSTLVCLGDREPPQVDGVRFIQVGFHKRPAQDWYKFPS